MVTLKCCTMESTTSLWRELSSEEAYRSQSRGSESKRPTCSHAVDTSQVWCPPHRGRRPSWGFPPGSSWPEAWWASPWCHSRASEALRTGAGPQRLLKSQRKRQRQPFYNDYIKMWKWRQSLKYIFLNENTTQTLFNDILHHHSAYKSVERWAVP